MYASNTHPWSNTGKPLVTESLDPITAALPRITIPLQEFYQRRIKIFRILHLIYQDLKLTKINYNYLEDLSYLLFCYSKYLDHYYSSYYCDYYLRENPKIIERFTNDLHLKQLVLTLKTKESLTQQGNRASQRSDLIDDSFNENSLYILEREPPDLMKWIQERLLLRGKDLHSAKMNIQPHLTMPVAFQTTKFACKIFELLTTGAKGTSPQEAFQALRQASSSRLSDLLNRNFTKNVQDFLSNHDLLNKVEYSYPLYHQSLGDIVLSDQEKFKANYPSLRENASSVPEQIFLYLIKKTSLLQRYRSIHLV